MNTALLRMILQEPFQMLGNRFSRALVVLGTQFVHVVRPDDLLAAEIYDSKPSWELMNTRGAVGAGDPAKAAESVSRNASVPFTRSVSRSASGFSIGQSP